MSRATGTSILDGARLLARHGGVVEVRMLKTTKATVSGYFDDLEALVKAITPWDGKTNIYVTANPVDPALLARATNRLKAFATETTADKDIVRRAWFLTDYDPARPKGISATTAQVAAALARRDETVAFLRELGFPDPWEAMSGNGGHAGYAVDLPNDEATRLLFEQALKALKGRFSDPAVDVDETVFNAARIWKCYGTTACKGDATADRPHRRAELERVPAELVTVDRELLAALAGMAPSPLRTVSAPRGAARALPPLDLVGAFQARGWYKRALHGGKHAVQCPWHTEHSGESGITETCLFDPKGPGEPWGYRCQHSHCSGRTIKDVIAVLGLAPMNGHDAGRYADVEPEDEEPRPRSAAPALHIPPATGFVARYVDAARRRTDAPAEAHELAAVVLLSALAGSRMRLPLAYRADGVRCVLWGMNLADSTGNRKTTVNELACDIIRRVLGEEALLPWKGSPEAFVQALKARDGQASVLARDEYTGLLAPMKRGGYVAGLAQDFIRAYDGLPLVMARTAKMNRKTGQRVDDTDRVRDPYLVKLCAATRTSFIQTASIEDVLDGLLARFTFTSGVGEERAMRPMSHEIETAWQAVVALARGFHERAEERLALLVTPEVLDLEWALERRLKAVALAQPRPDAARPALKRLAETVLKVAALLAIDRATTGTITVEPEDFEAAQHLAAPWERTVLGLLTDLGRTRFQARADAILATIRAHPEGVTRRKVFRDHRGLTAREFDDVIIALEGQGLIHHLNLKATRGGHATMIYRPGRPRS